MDIIIFDKMKQNEKIYNMNESDIDTYTTHNRERERERERESKKHSLFTFR